MRHAIAMCSQQEARLSAELSQCLIGEEAPNLDSTDYHLALQMSRFTLNESVQQVPTYKQSSTEGIASTPSMFKLNRK